MQSWVHGQLIKQFEPQAVELYKSQGYETQSSKYLMRLTVLLSDVLSKLRLLLMLGREVWGGAAEV